jgi:hypothetical protein
MLKIEDVPIFLRITQRNINQLAEDTLMRFAEFCTVRYKVVRREQRAMSDVRALQPVGTNNGDQAGEARPHCADFGVKISVKSAVERGKNSPSKRTVKRMDEEVCNNSRIVTA